MPRTDLSKSYTHKGRLYERGVNRYVPDSLLDWLLERGEIPEVGYEEAGEPQEAQNVREESTSEARVSDAEAVELDGAPAPEFPAMDVSESVQGRLVDAGYDSTEAIQAASDDELLEIDGVGPATLQKIREASG